MAGSDGMDGFSLRTGGSESLSVVSTIVGAVVVFMIGVFVGVSGLAGAVTEEVSLEDCVAACRPAGLVVWDRMRDRCECSDRLSPATEGR